MRAFVLLCLSWSAFATPWSSKVLHEGKPVAGAVVRLFAKPSPIAGCPAAARPDVLGKCLCPAHQEAFTRRALLGLESPQPLATTTTALDGSFTISPEGAVVARIATADGTLGASIKLADAPAEISLQPTLVKRLKLSGLSEGAAIYLLDHQTGEFHRFTQHEGEWVGPPVLPNFHSLLAFAPGAVPARIPMINGHLLRGGFKFEGSISDITLVAPQELSGIVTERGRLMPGVTVIADPETCALPLKTDSKGAFAFPSIAAPPAMTAVLVRAPGKVASAYLSVEQPVELTLKPAASLQLTFVDARGQPVAGVEGGLSGQDLARPQQVPSDAKGQWPVAELIDGVLQLRVNHPWVLISDAKLPVKGATRLRAVVAPAVTVTGRVVDGQGNPISGANIVVQQPGASEAVKDALRMVSRNTDVNGGYELQGLLPGRYEVVAKSAAFGESSLVLTAPGQADFTLASPFVLEAEVADPSGKPLEKVYVSFRVKGDSNPNYNLGAFTGPDGRFRYALNNPGSFEVSVNGSKPQLSELPGGKPLRFVIEAGGLLRGVVVDAEGTPRGGVRVQAVSASLPQVISARMLKQPFDPAGLVATAKAMRMYEEATTGDDGLFTIPRGKNMVLFAETGVEATDPVTGKPGTPVRLVLAARAHAKGRVLDWSGRPMRAFSVNGQPIIAADGRFEVKLPRKGPATLRFDNPLSVALTQTIEVPEVSIDLGDLTLARGYTVTGQVLAAQTGQPVTPWSTVKATHAQGEVDTAAVQQDGSFTLKRVPAGKLELTASNPEYLPATLSLQVKEGMNEPVFKLLLITSLEISVLKNNEPAVRASLEAVGPDGARTRGLVVDGKFKLKAGPGMWTVTVEGLSRSVKLANGEQGKLELSVP